jgi:hypothetical protein
MLVYTGVTPSFFSPGSGSIIFAPYRPSSDNYAVQAEIQYVGKTKTWYITGSIGLAARFGDDGGYILRSGGESMSINRGSNGCYGSPSCLGNDPLGIIGIKVSPVWVKYRIEVVGNNIRGYIGESKLLEVTNNQYIRGRMVGVGAFDSAQINVRSFEIIAR